MGRTREYKNYTGGNIHAYIFTLNDGTRINLTQGDNGVLITHNDIQELRRITEEPKGCWDWYEPVSCSTLENCSTLSITRHSLHYTLSGLESSINIDIQTLKKLLSDYRDRLIPSTCT